MDAADWESEALCRTEAWPQSLFFPPDNGADARKWTPERAKLVCADCPVLVPCLFAALRDRTTVGIWGHTTEYERRQLERWMSTLTEMSEDAVRRYIIKNTRWKRIHKHGNRLPPPLKIVRNDDTAEQRLRGEGAERRATGGEPLVPAPESGERSEHPSGGCSDADALHPESDPVG